MKDNQTLEQLTAENAALKAENKALKANKDGLSEAQEKIVREKMALGLERHQAIVVGRRRAWLRRDLKPHMDTPPKVGQPVQFVEGSIVSAAVITGVLGGERVNLCVFPDSANPQIKTRVAREGHQHSGETRTWKALELTQ